MARFRLSGLDRRGVWLAVADGRRASDVAAEFATSTMTVSRIRHDPGVKEAVYRSSDSPRLDLAAREIISRALAEDVMMPFRQIAARVGCHPSTISREIDRNGGRLHYRAFAAQRCTDQRARRPKPTKFQRCPSLAAQVEAWLELEWSPDQIHARLIKDFPDDQLMRVSHETIYGALLIHSRGGLRKELAKHLRTRRDQRRPRPETARNRGRSPIPNMVNIAERPEEVAERLVPGHWEGDLIIGKGGHSQVLTLVERVTGLVMLAKLNTKQAHEVAVALQDLIGRLPDYLARSITWDQGTEMADHQDFTLATSVKVYFCDPRSPWQRGSNENTNGLLRQYLPRDTNLSKHSQADLDAIAHRLNGRPRKRHRYKTPLEVFNPLVLH